MDDGAFAGVKVSHTLGRRNVQRGRMCSVLTEEVPYRPNTALGVLLPEYGRANHEPPTHLRATGPDFTLFKLFHTSEGSGERISHVEITSSNCSRSDVEITCSNCSRLGPTFLLCPFFLPSSLLQPSTPHPHTSPPRSASPSASSSVKLLGAMLSVIRERLEKIVSENGISTRGWAHVRNG